MNARCVAHCAACGLHFANDGAFDRHRVFEDGHDGDWDYRTCGDVEDMRHRDGTLVFAPKSLDGCCLHRGASRGGPVDGIAVWTLRANLERDQAGLRRLRRGARMARQRPGGSDLSGFRPENVLG